MATTPLFFWPYQALTDPPNGASLGSDLALAIESTMATIPASVANHQSRLDAIDSTWSTYIPAWTTAGSAPALGNGTIFGHYKQIGNKTFHVFGEVLFGSTSTFGTNEFRFSLPVTAIGFVDQPGAALVLDAGTTRYSASSLVVSGANYLVINAGSTNFVTATNPFTFTTSDAIWWSATYEAA